MNLDIKLLHLRNINILVFHGNIEKNVYLTVHNKTNVHVLEKCYNTSYIFYPPRYSELISLLYGIVRYNYMIMNM